MVHRKTSRTWLSIGWLIAALLATMTVAPLAAAAAAPQITYPEFADPAFQRTWERLDHPVYFGDTSRSYTWGGQVTAGITEPYKEGSKQQHLVQYYDKSRMEINNPSGDQNRPFFVTQGLLARDMIRGEIQEGDTTFRPAPQGPSQVPFGDLDDTEASSPTYASFQKVLAADPVPAGQVITARIDRAGAVTNDSTTAQYNVTSTGVLSGTPDNTPGFNRHSIASVFLSFIQQTGPVYENGQNTTAQLYAPIQYVFGYAITEAYWATVKADNADRTVLIQCFERRCLTYAPGNDPAFRVEMANTGLQYYTWRYHQTAPGPVGKWTTTAPASLSLPNALLPLNSGQVLLLGQTPQAPYTSQSQRYDPASNSWSAPVTISTPDRNFFTAVRLAGGGVLVIGGSTNPGVVTTNSVSRYTPATDSWGAATSMSTPRTSGHTATLLKDGRVLVTGGGVTPAGVPLASAEIYDPKANSWTSAGAMATARYDHTATLLADGRVLVAGGRGELVNGNNVLASAELYDPATNKWSPAAPLIAGRWGHAALLLPNGQVLVLGAGTPERYDPATNSWTTAAPIPAPVGDPASRTGFTASLLKDGQVMITGGQVLEQPGCQGTHCRFIVLTDTERYDPANDRWTRDAPMNRARMGHRAAVLADGHLFVVGGQQGQATSEIYTPPAR